MNSHESTHRRVSPVRKSWIIGAGVAAAIAVLGGSGVAAAATLSPSASSDSAATTATGSTTPAPTSPTGGGQPVSGPADGGATGIIESTSASGFTISTWTGVNVTVDETSSTKIVGGPKKDVRKGESVLVLGLVNVASSAASITAAQVDLQQHGDGGAKVGQKDGVVPATPGTSGPTKSVGTIPSSYTQGQGTIVSGTQAYAAVKAAQATFPGGVVDRVVELSNGDYEVHNMAIAWPHHVFVTPNYKVMGAND